MPQAQSHLSCPEISGLRFKKIPLQGACFLLSVLTLVFSCQQTHGQTAPTGEIVINELLAINDAAYEFGNPPQRPTFPDAIELRNLTGNSIDLTGYGISDNDSPEQWEFPAGTEISANGFLIVIANGAGSGLQADFKLSSAGEAIVLTDPAGEVVERILFPRQQTNISYGRLEDGSYAFFSSPTIGFENDGSSASSSLIKRPRIDQESGIYTDPIQVALTASVQQIRYTTDGSQPTASSPLYTGSISILETTVLKSVAIEGSLLSEVASRTFLFDVSHDLPVIILTADNLIDRRFINDGNTFDEEIYSQFVIDGRIRFDFLETDGSLKVSQYAEFETSGRNSAIRPPINGKIIGNAKYGNTSIDHRFFPEKQEREFDRILIRNTSQDYASARLRDGVFSRFLSEGDIVDADFEGYRPCVLYLNGRYVGHVNIREDDDTAFVKQYFDLTLPVTKRRLTGGGNVFLTPLTNPTSADAIVRLDQIRRVNESLLDDALRDSMGVHRFDSFVTRWQPSDPTETIRVSLHDYDLAFNLREDPGVAPSTWSQIRWRNLSMDGDDIRFWEEAIQFTAAYQNLFAYPERLEAIIDAAASEIRSEMPRTIEFYKQRRIEVGRPLPPNFNRELELVVESMAEWEEKVAFLREFPGHRLEGSLDAMKATYSLPDLIEVDIASTSPSMGDVTVHGFRVTPGRTLGRYFSTFPIRLQAEPKPGHVFLRWEGDVSGSDSSLTVSFSGAATVRAVFAPGSMPIATSGNIVISEIFYNPESASEDDEFLELANLSNETIDLEGARFVEGIRYTFPEGAVIAPNSRIVIRPSEYKGNLSNGGERLTLIDANEITIENFVYRDGDPWPEAADGLGHSLVRIKPEGLTPASDPASWRPSLSKGGNPESSDSIALADSSAQGLLLYAFGTENPKLGAHIIDNSFELSFEKTINADDVAVSLQYSLNLQSGNWIDMPGDELLSEDLPQGNKENITVQSMTFGNQPRFFRLKVEAR